MKFKTPFNFTIKIFLKSLKSHNINVVLWLFIFIAPNVKAAPEGFDVSYICRFGAEVRTIRVVPPGDDGRCRSIYTKQGIDQEVGKGMNPQSCIDIMNGVKKRIEEGGWKCREVKGATLSLLNSDAEN